MTRRSKAMPMALALLLSALPATMSSGVVRPKDLGGSDRYLTHVGTDKPIYRAGEKVYVRGVVLGAADHAPLPKDQPTSARIEIVGPKGSTVAQGHAASVDSVVAFAWPVPDGAAGGSYLVRITHPSSGHTPAERQFEIRAYRTPRLKSQIVFLRDGYGPGDLVAASLHVERAEGGVPIGAKVTVVGRVDGAEVHRGTMRVDARGNCDGRFRLPATIERGEGTIAFLVEDGGTVETASKTIPILLQTLDVSVYPEGGALIGGLPSRVYVEARTPARKPADFAGVVVDGDGRTVVRFRTRHEGRGRFAFTPEVGGTYTLRVTEPTGIDTTYDLPAPKARGAVLRSAEDRTAAGRPVRLSVAATEGPVSVTLSDREVELSSVTIDEVVPGRLSSVVLTPPASADGVLIATVWNEAGRPLAERLVYRAPARRLSLDLETESSSYVPGDRVTLNVLTRDERGRPIGAVVGLAATDDSLLEMIETREQAPRLPVMVLIENDVRELADAHVYLDESDPDAPRALDLLLGTQGWRRFAFVDPLNFIATHGDAAQRVLAMRRPRPIPLQSMMLGGVANGVVKVAAAVEREPDVRAVRGNDGEWAEGKQMPAAAVEPAGPVAQVAGELKEEDLDRAIRVRRNVGRRIAAAEAWAPEPPANDMVAVRVYAHQVRPDRQAGDRVDFTETIYWNAAIRTDERTGRATVSFDLSDSVTSFRVHADGFTGDGALGSRSTLVESVEPFYIEPKMPLELTSGDLVSMPVAVVNATDRALPDVSLSATLPGVRVRSTTGDRSIAPDARARRIVEIDTTGYVGAGDLVVQADARPYRDAVTRPLRVRPIGFPIEIAHGGMLQPNETVTFEIDVPETRVEGSLHSRIAIYPTPLANLTEALERLIREPYGCFEQTSSTTYPLVMAQQYFLSHTGVDPEIVTRSGAMLEKGYRKLVGFECTKKGYEWFGQDPGHEALTAYGLLEFSDMAEVRQVDRAMLDRTRAWLMGSRDGKGGFTRKRRALHTWIADADCSNGYITWALLETGQPVEAIRREIDAFLASASDSRNSYVIALGANVAASAGDAEAARPLMSRLASLQGDDGFVDGASTSIVGSGGDALKIETTALAVLAWLHDESFAGSVEPAMQWLADSCKAGRYGSTQSTVLALRAIVAYDRSRAHPKAAGNLVLSVDGDPVGTPISFDTDAQGPIVLADIAQRLAPGRHQVSIRMKDGSAMPFSLAVDYHDRKPASSQRCRVALAVSLADDALAEGEITEANVVVTVRGDEAVPTPIAIVGLPGGLEVRHDQLKELVAAGTIAAYEVLGREVVLYWRSLEAGRKVEVPLSLVAAVPGHFTAPASRAYLYYTDEHKHWVEPLAARIRVRAPGLTRVGG
ncbi:MAG: A-macroglobulin complement component [Phycisphaeraceae bacterium]|nr:A-macroglobulin complement component [Phycisphaeraceae bacterium]